MKTLSKGIYLLEKGEHWTTYADRVQIHKKPEGKILDIKGCLLDQLTEEQGFDLNIHFALSDIFFDEEPIRRFGGEGIEKEICLGYINTLLLQNNLPELREGERPHDDPRMSYYWDIATDPANILIEIP